jgi:hypothetical protein
MNTVINYITTGGLYVLFGLWSFFQVLEYKYYTRIEQYDTIVENIKICKEKYVDLLVKITQLENRVDELEDILVEHNLDGAEEEEDLKEEEDLEEEKLSLDAEALKKAELEELNKVKEVEQMANEEHVTTEEEKELNEVNELNELNELNEVKETVAENLEDEMVDISEETYPIKNQVQNKKSWLKTILFM